MSGTAHVHGTAPGELALAHAFLNTWYADGARERFDSPERLRDWLARRSLIPPDTPVSRQEFEAVRQFRDALRAVVGASGRGTRRERPDQLNTLVRTAPLVVQFDPTGTPELAPAGAGVQAAIARIVAVVVIGATEGTWSRLKLCRNVECQRVFYDTSKNHSAVWCSSQRCGNRMAARAYRARAQGAQKA